MSERLAFHHLVLASSSPYRRELLRRLGLPFDTASPEVDERVLVGEPAHALVERLAVAKAQAVAEGHARALIIGSDQVAALDGDILGKPVTHERAVAQLTQAAGRAVTFYTGLCLLDSGSGRWQSDVIPFSVVFRRLTPEQIDGYLRRERPYDCAGSFRSEGLGIALFEEMQGPDPTALVGLPLIRLIRMLEVEGVDVLAAGA